MLRRYPSRFTSALRGLALRAALVAAALPLVASASAQISVTRADYAAVYAGSFTSSTFDAGEAPATLGALEALAGRTGSGQTWDFRGLPYAEIARFTSAPVQPPQPGSDDPHFAQATLVTRSDSAGTTSRPVYSYVRLTDDALTLLGSAVSIGGELQKVKFVPGETQPLPLTVASRWISEYELQLDPSPFPGRQTNRDENEVVGWGTLQTPAGAEPALMVRTLSISRSQIEFPGVPPIDQRDSSTVVSFVTRGRMSAFVSLDKTGRATGGGYSAAAGGGTAGEPAPGAEGGLRLAVGPNPATGPIAVRVAGTAERVTVHVHDALGRRVATLAQDATAAEAAELQWDSSALPPGLYVVRATDGRSAAVRTISVLR